MNPAWTPLKEPMMSPTRLLLLCALLTPAFAQQPYDLAKQRTSVVETAGRLMAERYVFEDKGAECQALLARRLKSGAYEEITNPSILAQRLTEDLRSVTKDLHVRVMVRPREAPAANAPSPEVMRKRRMRSMQRRNFGFEKLERLPGNIGYLDLRGFMVASYAGDTANAAMAFLSNSDAVIIDLRQNGGGSPSMIQLISSYFFDEPTHLNSFFWRGQEQIDQFWTLPHVPGKTMADVPLYILTSRRTFSAAEEFTYNLKNLKRATIIGQTTGGGAHPGGTNRIDDAFAIWIPRGRAINPVTKTNWEGTGIKPHIEVPVGQALAVARREATKKLIERTDDPREKEQLKWDLASIEASINPVTVSPTRLRKLAGTFGPRRITLADGCLWYEREGRGRRKLHPLSDSVFQPEGLAHFRIRFIESDGKVVRLVGMYDDGRTDESPRTDG